MKLFAPCDGTEHWKSWLYSRRLQTSGLKRKWVKDSGPRQGSCRYGIKTMLTMVVSWFRVSGKTSWTSRVEQPEFIRGPPSLGDVSMLCSLLCSPLFYQRIWQKLKENLSCKVIALSERTGSTVQWNVYRHNLVAINKKFTCFKKCASVGIVQKILTGLFIIVTKLNCWNLFTETFCLH